MTSFAFSGNDEYSPKGQKVPNRNELLILIHQLKQWKSEAKRVSLWRWGLKEKFDKKNRGKTFRYDISHKGTNKINNKTSDA